MIKALKVWVAKSADGFGIKVPVYLAIMAAVIVGLISGSVALIRSLTYEPPRWVTTTATLDTVEQLVVIQGTVEKTNQAAVSFPIAAEVLEVYAALGDEVVPGQLIARIDDRGLQQALDSAQATYDRSRYSLSQLEAARDMSDALGSANGASGSGETMDIAEALGQMQQLAAQMQQAQQDATTAYQQLTSECSWIGEQLPGGLPTTLPTALPSGLPTSWPSWLPTSLPSVLPSGLPTELPSVLPSGLPTELPSVLPSGLPTELPSVLPSGLPTVLPSELPTALPTGLPSEFPTVLPTGLPTGVPTNLAAVSPSESSSTASSTTPTDTTTSPTDTATSPTNSPTTSPTEMPTLPPEVSEDITQCLQALRDLASAGVDLVNAQLEAMTLLSSVMEGMQGSLAGALGGVSINEVTLAAARAAVSAAERSLLQAQIDLEEATIRSPIAGVLAQLPYVVGEQERTSEEALIIGPGTVTVTLAVPLAQIPLIQPGQLATISQVGSGEVSAVVTSKALLPATADSTDYQVVVSSVAAANALRAGARATVEIKVSVSENAVTLPVSAVHLSGVGDTAEVLLLAGADAEVREVTYATIGGGRIAITSGLQVGETVILADGHKPLPDLLEEIQQMMRSSRR
ncbi:MAG: biotin/lipoyl-binding protein [Propionibacteriaceae bacterium]|jgi:multidrug efflux pump subunit AcrA (membrane-fusion protein)|nr:biotin/lipoyl-binding protein [Propionibacteriaceae bacterium]